MTDNTRDCHPYIYTGSHQDKEEEKYGYLSYTNGATLSCGYCGMRFPVNRLEPISVTRNSKRREMWLCQNCQEDMKLFKESFGLI